MSARTQIERTVSMPPDLQSPRTKLVYYCLATSGRVTADELCATLDVDKGSVLSIVGTLRNRGHVRRVQGRYELA